MVGLYGISNFLRYLIPNLIFTYIYIYIYIYGLVVVYNVYTFIPYIYNFVLLGLMVYQEVKLRDQTVVYSVEGPNRRVFKVFSSTCHYLEHP